MRQSCQDPRPVSYELDRLLVVRVSPDLQRFGRDAYVDFDDTVHDTDGVRIHRKHRGKRAHLASQEVESRPMARALDQALLELALAEHAAVVRADVVDRAPRVVLAMAERETLVAGVNDLDLTECDLVLARHGNEPAQARTPISAMLPMRGRSAFSTRWRTCSSSSWLMTRRKKPWTMSCCA